MKKTTLSMMLLGSLLAVGTQAAFAAPDWSKVPKRDVHVFHPGVSPMEWVGKKSDHSGTAGLKKGETCVGCHEEKGALNFDFKRLAGKVDRVLVDAPCSGLGTLRRNPDLKWRQKPADVAELQVRQQAILASAVRLLKPGGRLIYATCSILPDENEQVAEAFSAAQPGLKPLPVQGLLEQAKVSQAASLCGSGGLYLRLWPHLHATDGFFAAAWEKPGG